MAKIASAVEALTESQFNMEDVFRSFLSFTTMLFSVSALASYYLAHSCFAILSMISPSYTDMESPRSLLPDRICVLHEECLKAIHS